MTATTFADWLERLMRERGISGNQVAAFAEVSPSMVTNWRRGAVPKPDTIRRLAEKLNVPYDEPARAAGYMPPLEFVVRGDAISGRTPATDAQTEPLSPQEAIIELAAQALRGVTSPGDSPLSHDEILARLEAVGGKRVTRKIPIQKAYAHAGEEGVEGAFMLLPSEPVSETIVAVPINGGCMEPIVLGGDTVYVDTEGSPRDGDLVLAVNGTESRPVVRWFDKTRAELWSEDGSEPIPFTSELVVLPILGIHRPAPRNRR